MVADTGALTNMLDQFLSVFKLGQQGVSLHAWSLLTILATIDLVLAAGWWAITGEDALVGLIKKILYVGFFVFVVQNYDSLLHTVVEGFIFTGKAASSAGGDELASVRDPSSIIDAGFYIALPIFDHLRSYSNWDALFNIHDLIICGLCALGILFAYITIAIQVFVTYLEFALVSTLGLMLIPFGTLKHTRFLAEKVFGSIIAFGVKLMVLGLLVSVTVPVLKGFSLPADPTWTQLLSLLAACVAVAALTWHAPGVAAGLLSGGPSLTASSAVGSTVAGASGVATAGMVARNTVADVTSTGAQATKAAAGAIGAGVAGAQVGAENARLAGGSAVVGATKGAGSALVMAAARPAAQAVGAPFKAGQQSVSGYAALRSSNGGPPSASPTGSRETAAGANVTNFSARQGVQHRKDEKETSRTNGVETGSSQKSASTERSSGEPPTVKTGKEEK